MKFLRILLKQFGPKRQRQYKMKNEALDTTPLTMLQAGSRQRSPFGHKHRLLIMKNRNVDPEDETTNPGCRAES